MALRGTNPASYVTEYTYTKMNAEEYTINPAVPRSMDDVEAAQVPDLRLDSNFLNHIPSTFILCSTLNPESYSGVPRALENAPPKDSTVGPCLGAFGGPRGVAVSCKRGAPVRAQAVDCTARPLARMLRLEVAPVALQGHLAHDKMHPPLVPP